MTDQESLRIPRLENLIKSLKISQKEFSERTGINYQYISHLLSGYRPVTLSTIYKIKEAFPLVNIDWIRDGDGEMFLSDNDDLRKYSDPEKEVDAQDIKLDELSDILRYYRDRIENLEKRLSKVEGRIKVD